MNLAHTHDDGSAVFTVHECGQTILRMVRLNAYSLCRGRKIKEWLPFSSLIDERQWKVVAREQHRKEFDNQYQ